MSAAASESALHPLLRELRSVRSAARGVLLAHILLRFTLALIGAFALAAGADFVFRPTSPAVRFTLSGAVLAAGVIAAVRGRRLLSSFDGRDVPLARRLEVLLPQPRPPLAAAVEFLTMPRTGSAQLRAAVVARCWDDVRRIPLRDVVDRSTLRPWFIALLAASVIIGGWGLLRSNHARAAWLRISAPWETYRWPQRHLLAFVDPPERVAEGAAVHWSVVDRGEGLPERVTLELRDDGESETRRVILQNLGARAVGVTENVRRSFWYRARGGDDDSLPWKFVAVVPAPRLANWRLLVESQGQSPRGVLPPVQMRLGSRLTMEGRVEPGTTAVRVRSGDVAHHATVAVNGDFSLPATGEWSPAVSGEWNLEALDATGVVGRQAIVRVEIMPNQPPQLAWDTPADGDVIGARGLLRIRGSAADDVRVRRVQLRGGEQVISLPIVAAERVALNVSVPAGALTTAETPQTLQLRLLAEDVEGGRTETPPRRVTVIAAAEMESRLIDEFAEQAAALRELTQEQRSLRDEVERGRGQAGRQRELERRLTEPNAGLLTRVRRSLTSWEDNQLGNRTVVDAWRTAAERLRTLAANDMKSAAAALDAAPRAAETVAIQEELVASLENILRDVSSESRAVDLERAFAQLGHNQREVLSAAQSLLLRSLTEKVDPAELRPVQTQQNELAREADRLQQAVAAEARFAAIAEIARRQSLGAKMREAAAAVEENTESAIALREQVAAGIDEILRAFRGENPAESVADGEQRLTELTEWVRRQTAALDAWRAKLDEGAAAFAAAESALADEIERAAGGGKSAAERTVRRQLATAVEQLRAAARAAAMAPREALTNGIAGEATLQDARRALVAAIDALRQQAAQQEAARLAEETRAFIARQERLADRTSRAGREDAASRVAAAELLAAAGEQGQLADDLRSTAAEKSALYRFVLLEAARAAAQAARRLDGRDAGVETLRLQQETLTVLRQLLRALDEDVAQDGIAEDERPRPPGGEDERPAAARSAAELSLVLERQQAVLKATTNAARRLPANSPERREAGVELGRQQGGLAELAEGWARERGDRPAPIPEPLSDSLNDEQWRQRVAGALIEGEDLGAEKLTVFTRLASLMRTAESGLTAGKLNEPTERLQSAVIKDLEALVAAAGKKRRDSQRNPATAGQGSTQSNAGDGDPMNAAANDSTGRRPAATAPIFDPRTLEHQLRAVWGNLPEKIREDLRQTSAEEFLPEYERLIIDYYRRLAEEPREAP